MVLNVFATKSRINANLGKYMMERIAYISSIVAQKEQDGTSKNVSLFLIVLLDFMEKVTIVSPSHKDAFLQQNGQITNVH